MKKTKIMSVLVAMMFCFSVVGSSLASVRYMEDQKGEEGSWTGDYMSPAQAAKEGKKGEKKEALGASAEEDTLGAIWLTYKVEDVVKKEDNGQDKYFVQITIDSQTYLGEVSEKDKGKIEAYPAEELVATTGKNREVIDGVIPAQYINILAPSNNHIPAIEVNGKAIEGAVEGLEKQNGEGNINVGRVTGEDGRNIYVEVPEEYVGAEGVKVTIDISKEDNARYIQTSDGRYVIPKENVTFNAAGTGNGNGNGNTNGNENGNGTGNENGNGNTNGNENGNGNINENKNINGNENGNGTGNENGNGEVNEIKKVDVAKEDLNQKTDITKPDTYGKIKQTKKYLVIYNKNGKSLIRISIKGMSNKQIELLKKYYNENIANKSVEAAKEALKNLKNKVKSIMKGNTYAKIKVIKNKKKVATKIKLYNQKGKVVKKINIKGLKSHDIKEVKAYFKSKLYAKSSKTTAKALKRLQKKIKRYKKINKRIIKKYGKKGLNRINKIANEISYSQGYSIKQVYRILAKNKIGKNQINKVYKQLRKMDKAYYKKHGSLSWFFWDITEYNFKKAVSNVKKGKK